MEITKSLLQTSVIDLEDSILWAKILNGLEDLGMIDIDTTVYNVNDDSYMLYYEKIKDEIIVDNNINFISNGWIVISLSITPCNKLLLHKLYPTRLEVEAIKSLNNKLVFSSMKMLVNEITNCVNKLNKIPDAS